MSHIPDTRDSLLVQVRDPANQAAWEEFTAMYRPVIWRMARRSGLQDADADDLTQQVMSSVASSIANWEKSDESTGFRNWLRRIARNAILNLLTRGPRAKAHGGTDFLNKLHCLPASSESLEEQLEREYQRQIYRQAAEAVRKSVQAQTWQAFLLTTTEGWSVDRAAGHLQLSIGSIHAARSRVMRRLQFEVRRLMEADE